MKTIIIPKEHEIDVIEKEQPSLKSAQGFSDRG